MKNKRAYLILLVLILALALIISAYLFKAFESEPDCKTFSYADCPQNCVVCPSCETCSSVSCQTEESCAKIGFNRTWHEDIKKRLQETDK
jgi:hypothetical protein